MAEKDLDLEGGGGDPPDPPDTPRRPGRPKGSRTTRAAAASGKVQEAQKALEASLKRVGDVLNPKAPEFAATFKRDAPKMAEAVAALAAKRPNMLKAIMFLFGPGSVAFAIEAFLPTILHVRRYLRERREGQVEYVDELGRRVNPDGSLIGDVEPD